MDSDLKEEVYKIKHQLEIAKKNLKTYKDISKSNRDLLEEFITYAEARGLSAHRIMIYIKHLRIFAKCLNVDFDKADRKDMEKAFAKLYSKKIGKEQNKGYSDWTLETIRRIVKAYWRWLYKLEEHDKLPDCVNWVKGKRPPTKLNAEDLLTQEEISKLICATDNTQYKALISCLAETGARIGEILQIQRQDIYVNDTYIKIRVSGKTESKSGKRDIFLIKSYGVMLEWLNNHPDKDKQNYPIWISKNRTPLALDNFGHILKRIKRNAGINKRIYPYIFRHTRATELYKTKPAMVVQKLLGHGEKMSRTYTHLSSDDVLEMLQGKLQVQKAKNVTCSRCKFVNSFVADYCTRCGLAMNEKIANANEERLERMELAITQLAKNLVFDKKAKDFV